MIFLQIEKASETFINYGAVGVFLILVMGALIFVVKYTQYLIKENNKVKDALIAELRGTIKEREDSQLQLIMNYLANVNTMVENNTEALRNNTEVMHIMKAIVEHYIPKNKGL